MNKQNRIFKTLIIYVFPIIAFILCLFSKESSQAARKALYLCLDIVIPSLFPFFVLSRIIMPYVSDFSCPNFLKVLVEKFFKLPYYTILIIILGFISGYPNGAKMARDMFDQSLVDSRQATKILLVANYCSPLFVIGTIGVGLFKSIKLGLLLLLIHWVSGLIAAFIAAKITASNNSDKRGIYTHKWRSEQNDDSMAFRISEGKIASKVPFSFLLTSSIEEAAILCIKLTGYIVFFAVLAELLSLLGVFSFLGKIIGLFFAGNSKWFSELMTAIFRGFLEITSGAQAINQIKGIQLNMQLAAISLIFGFAGFSVHTQIMGIMKGTKSKYSTFIIAKLLHGFIAFSMTLLIAYFMPMAVETSTIDRITILDWAWTRPVIILLILISLLISPYRIPIKKKANR